MRFLGKQTAHFGNIDHFSVWYCKGISLKTQELYALVFVTRYLDLFTDFISLYNTMMKLVFITSSLAIVWCMRGHRVVRRTYDKEIDTFRHYFLVLGCFVLALILHEKFTIQEVTHCSFLTIYYVALWICFVSITSIYGQLL